MAKEKKNHQGPTVYSLPPIYDSESKILILGSLPGKKSSQSERYYANPRNQFWDIIRYIYDKDEKEPFSNYDEKIAFLHKHHIAIWDIYSDAIRPGSLDSNIGKGHDNVIESIVEESNIETVFCNGTTARDRFEFYKKKKNWGIDTKLLPSSSSAGTTFDKESLTLEDKKEKWKRLIKG